MWAPLTVTMVVAVEVPWQVMGWVLIAVLLAALTWCDHRIKCLCVYHC